jgi:hypothetical protein
MNEELYYTSGIFLTIFILLKLFKLQLAKSTLAGILLAYLFVIFGSVTASRTGTFQQLKSLESTTNAEKGTL